MIGKNYLMNPLKVLIEKFSFAFIANICSTLVSVIITFFVPKFFGLEEFSNWQLYFFYYGYAIFLHLGWIDGIYLKYGGETYKNLDKNEISSQIKLFYSYEVLIVVFLILLTNMIFTYSERIFTIQMALIASAIYSGSSMLSIILQATNRIKSYSKIVISERGFFLILIFVLMYWKLNNFEYLVYCDILAKVFSLCWAIYLCKDTVFHKGKKFSETVLHTKEYIIMGSKNISAVISGTFIIGIIRFAIEKEWDVITFGKVSLTLSFSNILAVLIRSVSLVLFPALRRINDENLVNLYKTINNIIMVPIFGILVFYYPMKVFLGYYLPDYIDSINYMAILMPMCAYEAKNNMLVITYQRVLRQEKWILISNLITLSFSVVLTILTVFIMKNLDLAILLITFLLAFRSIISEIALSKSIKVNVLFDIYSEFIMSVIFIIANWSIGGPAGMIIYGTSYILYIIFYRKSIIKTIQNIKKYF